LSLHPLREGAAMKLFKCLVCGKPFEPDRRNVGRQKACTDRKCKAALKAVRQRNWHQKNPDYFLGPVHVMRVQAWRKENPDYSRRGGGQDKAEAPSCACGPDALQDALTAQPIDFQDASGSSKPEPGPHETALQDALPLQAVESTVVSCSSEASSTLTSAALQDALEQQHFVLMGLISQLTDNTLQDGVLLTSRRLLQLGKDVLSGRSAVAPK
jgi:hypothetical protein